MAKGKALDGKPYAGNPHVRFDEGEVAPAATPRRGSLLYNKSILTIATAGAALSLCAAVPAPQVSGVSMSQNSRGEATINYTLSDASAVITLDIQTNATGGAWASIGGKAVSGARGDVWKVVSTGSHRIKWDAATCWADHQIPASGIRAVVTAWALDNTPDYMAVDVSAGAQPNTQTYYPAADFVPGGVTNGLYKTTVLLMRKIMAKDVKWTMGSTTLETQRGTVEGTHQVTLTNNYYIGVYLITQTQWDLIQPSRLAPSGFKNIADRAMRPVENVCYNEIRNNANNSKDADTAYDWPAAPNPGSFLGKLYTRTGIFFDLPSEAQWEFACRAGNGDTRWGDGSSIMNDNPDDNLALLGRYQCNGGQVWNGESYVNPDWSSCGATNGTAIVGSYSPNDWGIYDMHGNVLEWCLDWYQANINAYGGNVNISPSDPTKTLSDAVVTDRIMRGGCWSFEAKNARPANRAHFPPNTRNVAFGFRVVCTAELR